MSKIKNFKCSRLARPAFIEKLWLIPCPDTDCFTRQCCKGDRSFDIKILDARTQKEVIHVHRPYRCSQCCCFCCLQSMSVECPPGNLIGKVNQQWSCCIPKFKIVTATGDVILRIKGPCCTQSCCCGDVEFQVLDKNGDKEVGKISKKWSGLLKEAFTDADNFGVTFPGSLDPKMKALMLGATFLIDFMFFETKNDDEQDKRQRGGGAAAMKPPVSVGFG